jgi:hypothetical protein
MKKYLIQEPIYNNSIVLIVNTNNKELKEKLNKDFGGIDWDNERIDRAAGFHRYLENKIENKSCHVIVVKNFEWLILDQETLAHEVLHCTFSILNDAGIDYFPSTANESFCYLFGFLYSKCLMALKKIYPKRKTTKK